ncbi:cytochrome b5-like heme/steroid binding domain-containing protein [Catenaria anguillulae PL171]|uniref:Cytochrome b5-like heme/steroid binding domain-containing protein n=1 Tax=Catenaria anguillulae PL171 TaxID=765915 RepID=A0A1Y2I4D7_9FUNG|nr:cytochrome b5-like heme/steroid binding domain-containing protein [Catenaria anguillulae PL171]
MFGNLTFNYKLPSLNKLKHKYFHKELVFTPETLKEFDGTDPTKPIYLAVLGKVYDVSAGREHYGPGGGYSFFSGRDAGRAFVTGCFETHLTPDLRGLSAEQLKGVDEWREFYDNHDQYFYVGTVVHPPIDPNTPIPKHCDEEPEAGGLAGTGGEKPVDK